MKSWKTTAAGIIGALGSWAAVQSDPWWMHKAGEAMQQVAFVLIGLAARDNNVPSAAVPSAAKTAERIKGDTAQFMRDEK